MDFLKAVTSAHALDMVRSFPVAPLPEQVDIGDADGRVLAHDIVSTQNIPPFPRSLVDGYAVQAKDTYGAKETTPSLLYVKGEVRIGEKTEMTLDEGFSIYLSTGSMVPVGADGVVMQEYVRRAGDAIEVTRSVFKGENICFEGEDIEKGACVLKAGRRLTPFDSGVLAALGTAQVPVFAEPWVALISSGDEIWPAQGRLPPGKVRDINRYTLSGILRRQGARVSFSGIAADNPADIRELLLASQDADMVLISGGSSKGERDFVTSAIEGLGGRILFHGVNIKPGKPTIFGELKGKPVFGLPGHPASCILAAVRFVLPLISRMRGEDAHRPRSVPAALTTNAPSAYGVEEYVRVAVERSGGALLARPIFSKSAVISSLSGASGYIIVPMESEGFEADEAVEVYLFD